HGRPAWARARAARFGMVVRRDSPTGPTLITEQEAVAAIPGDARDLHLHSMRRVAYRLLVECEHLFQSIAALADTHEKARFLDDARRVRDTAASLLSTRARVAAENGHAAAASSVQARIVVADDDPSLRALLVRRMAPLGFDVAAAEDGAQALELVRERIPDLVLTRSEE